MKKIYYLSGDQTTWNPKDNNRQDQVSDLHKKARILLKEIFPTSPILEEVHVPIDKNKHGFFDFYLPTLRIAVEVHGIQHYKFTPLFHSSTNAFLRQKIADKEKREWCELNGITYVELPYNNSIEEWKQCLVQLIK